jgi:hypothetical protein
MDKPRLNLKDFAPLWEREFPDLMHQPELSGLLGSDMNVFGSPSPKDRVGTMEFIVPGGA